MLPTPYVMSQIRKLRGGARVTYPDASTSAKRVERVVSLAWGSKELAYGTADEEYTDCLLTYQEQVGQDHQTVEVYRRWEKLPGASVVGYAMSEQGILEVTRQRVAAGSATILVSGTGTFGVDYKTQSAQIEMQDAVQGVLQKTALPSGTSYPEMVDFEYEEEMSDWIEQRKKIVPFADAIAANVGAGTSGGTQIRGYRSLDFLKAIQIVAKFPSNLGSAQVQWGDSVRVKFPPVLLSGPTEVTIYKASTGTYDRFFSFRLSEEFTTNCVSRITRTFSYGPVSAGTASGTTWIKNALIPDIVTFAGSGMREYFVYNDGGDQYVAWLILPECLHAAFNVTVSSGTTMEIAATSPPTLPTGQLVVHDWQQRRWKFGWWVQEKIEILVPSVPS